MNTTSLDFKVGFEDGIDGVPPNFNDIRDHDEYMRGYRHAESERDESIMKFQTTICAAVAAALELGYGDCWRDYLAPALAIPLGRA
jgi:hypothetical protein